MPDTTSNYAFWALMLGAVSAVSLPLGSLAGLNFRFERRYIAMFAAFGAGALIAALSVELVAPTAYAIVESKHAATENAHANFAAMLIGGVFGGVFFVALDTLINSKGGHLRKTSTTLAHMAKRRREAVRDVMQSVFAAPPFDALPAEMAQAAAGMLRLVHFKENDVVLGAGAAPTHAYIVLEGEVEAALLGKPATTFGPGTFVGVLALFVPDLANVATVRAQSSVKCLSIERRDVEQLRQMSPEFDRACRQLAEGRMGQLEQHLVTRHGEAVEWTRVAASALRLGREVPGLEIRRAHAEHEGSPLAVWLGILLDGIPESIVIGAGLFAAIAAQPDVDSLRFVHIVPYTLIAGLFLSNFPEALSSSANMQAAGWGRRRVFLMWLALMVMTASGAALGFLLAGVLSETWLVCAEGVAAGAMLTMIAAAMIPEAAAHGRPNEVGLSTLAGFLAAVSFKLLE